MPVCGFDKCPLEDELARIQREIKEMDEKNSANHKAIYDKIGRNEKNMAVAEERYTNILVTLNELKNDIAQQKAVPAKRWDSVISAIISGIVGVVVGLIMSGAV